MVAEKDGEGERDGEGVDLEMAAKDLAVGEKDLPGSESSL
jgi:hypothetical protein